LFIQTNEIKGLIVVFSMGGGTPLHAAKLLSSYIEGRMKTHEKSRVSPVQ